MIRVGSRGVRGGNQLELFACSGLLFTGLCHWDVRALAFYSGGFVVSGAVGCSSWCACTFMVSSAVGCSSCFAFLRLGVCSS